MNSFPKKLTAEVQSEFSRLMNIDANGLLKEEALVESARKPSSPLHKFFTWDKDEAANRWNLEEARQLIKSFTVYSEQLDTEVRVLTSLDIDRDAGGGFRWTTDVLERPDLREQFLKTALVELTNVENKYKHIVELAKVWQAVDEAKEKEDVAISKPAKKTSNRARIKGADKNSKNEDISTTNGFVAVPV
jgi:hypothetical protein